MERKTNLTSLRLSNDTQPPARDAPRLHAPIPRPPHRHAPQQDEQKRRDADDGEEGHEAVRGRVEAAVRRRRREPEHEEADRDADEQGADRVEDLDDGVQEADGLDLGRGHVLDVPADAVAHLEDGEGALGEGEGLGRMGKMRWR